MKHYWGADAIVRRLGYKSSQRLPELIAKLSIPAWKRPNPRNPLNLIYYTSEEALGKWELMQAQLYRERLIAETEQKRLVKEAKKRNGFSK